MPRPAGSRRATARRARCGPWRCRDAVRRSPCENVPRSARVGLRAPLTMDERADALALDRTKQRVRLREVEHDDRRLAVRGESRGGRIHDAELFLQHVSVRQLLELLRAFDAVLGYSRAAHAVPDTDDDRDLDAEIAHLFVLAGEIAHVFR